MISLKWIRSLHVQANLVCVSLKYLFNLAVQCTMLRLSTRKILPSSPFPPRPLSTLVRYQTPRPCRNLQYIAGSQIPRTSSHGSMLSVAGSAAFHSTPTRRGAPLIPLIALLKTSAAMEVVRTAGRIVLTIIPVILIKNHKSRRHLKHAALHGIPISEEKTTTLLKKIRNRTLLFISFFLSLGFSFGVQSWPVSKEPR
ncbi:hypothetical protein K438DRAFT_473555 [Mycena galopus ATCC 62051]|nr:hypothetical protein K438DRAFT_473555 [Mycena galopus ATCC 62051]